MLSGQFSFKLLDFAVLKKLLLPAIEIPGLKVVLVIQVRHCYSSSTKWRRKMGIFPSGV